MTDNTDGTLEQTYKALSNLISTFHIDLDGFCKCLKKQHIISTHQSCNTIVATSLKTGIDRRIVSKVIADEPIYHKPPFLHTILNNIEQLALKNSQMLVKKHGTDSVESIMLNIASGATTVKSIINLLEQSHCIEQDRNHIKFIANRLHMTEDRRRVLQQLSNELAQWIELVLMEYGTNGY